MLNGFVLNSKPLNGSGSDGSVFGSAEVCLSGKISADALRNILVAGTFPISAALSGSGTTSQKASAESKLYASMTGTGSVKVAATATATVGMSAAGVQNTAVRPQSTVNVYGSLSGDGKVFAWAGNARLYGGLSGDGRVKQAGQGTVSVAISGAGTGLRTLQAQGSTTAAATAQGSGRVVAFGVGEVRLQAVASGPGSFFIGASGTVSLSGFISGQGGTKSTLFSWVEGRAFRVVNDPTKGGISQGGIVRTEIIKGLQEI